jgi:hypothetical protein
VLSLNLLSDKLKSLLPSSKKKKKGAVDQSGPLLEVNSQIILPLK